MNAEILLSVAVAAAGAARTTVPVFWQASVPSFRVSSLAVDPESGREYASGSRSSDAVPVYVRSGPGAEWAPLASLPISGTRGGARLVLDPRGAAVAYASLGDCDGILTPNPACHGALFRTRDGGVSWMRLAEGAHGAVLVDPSNPATLYAGIATSPVPLPGILVRSDDEGVTWRTLPLPTDSLPTAIAISPSGRLVVGTYIGGLFVSDDGGETWAASRIDSTHDGVFRIMPDPADPNRIFAGTAAGLLRSDDGGATWGRVHYGDGVGFVASSGRTIFAGGYGNVYRSDDAGDTWVTLPLPDDLDVSALVVDEGRNVILVGTGAGVLERALDRTTRSLSPR